MKISYTILTHNETDSLTRLLEFVFEHKKEDDEIVVVDDYSKKPTREIFYPYSERDDFRYYQRKLKKDFAAQHNYANSLCRGDYIFSLDADEVPHEFLIDNVHELLENEVELIWVPRVNTVEGLTEKHIQKWGWRVNDKGWINYPDYQARIYKNAPHIKWIRPVHEYVTGPKSYAHLPPQEEFSIYHPKVIDKQETQNELYTEISKENR